ncbi:MAG: hypothetical protein ACOC1P_00095 [Minisyncoccales bacterium]
MFLTALLGFIDILSGLCLVLLPSHSVPARLAIGCSLYLIGKGYLFKGDFLSMLDLIIGILMLLLFFLPWKFLCIFLGIYVLGKGLFSLVSSFWY